jgi:hypothetical protein
MTDIQTGSEAPKPMESILQRVSMPLFLFSMALFGLLFTSRFFLLPRFTNFVMQGQTFDASEVAVYERSLNAHLVTMEDERMELALPVSDESYTVLKTEQRDQPQIGTLMSQMKHAAARAGINPDQLHIATVLLDADARTVQVEGDVRNAGPRSMTLLAGFVEEIESQFTDVVRPAFTRATDETIGMYSPFVLTFTVVQAGTPAL